MINSLWLGKTNYSSVYVELNKNFDFDLYVCAVETIKDLTWYNSMARNLNEWNKLEYISLYSNTLC